MAGVLAETNDETVVAAEMNAGGGTDTSGNRTAEEKGHTFRKRRLSLNTLNSPSTSQEEEEAENEEGIQETETGEETIDDFPHSPHPTTREDDEKAHSFRKRRLSLTLATHTQEDEEPPQESPTNNNNNNNNGRGGRRESNASQSSMDSSNSHLKSRTVHAAELLAQKQDSSEASSSKAAAAAIQARSNNPNHKLYQQSAPPQQRPSLLDTIDEGVRWKKRHTRDLHEDERKLPFPRDIVGTFSCHGVEPVYEDESDDEGSGDDDCGEEHKPTTAAKINQDRGGVAFPYGNCPRTALFAVYDGHGQGGELVAQYALHEVQRRLEKHKLFTQDIAQAFRETFLAVDDSLRDEIFIEPLYAGTTACVALLQDNKLVLANAGDSRAVLARTTATTPNSSDQNDSYTAIDLTQDQNPDLPEEQRRIEDLGGYVSPPPEPGLSARVWLDMACTQIGLAMARSIGDHAVKDIGVIAEPVVSFHQVEPNDAFVIFATDGVWEFVSSQEAVEVVAKHLSEGATRACQALIETAAARWHDEEGDYRDDITALVVRLQHLWDTDHARHLEQKFRNKRQRTQLP